jgi:hypothetical protein
MAYNFINMENKCLSKFVITSICIMTAILMFIITDTVYIFNAVAQTNETDIETNRIIDRQRTPSSEENSTDEVGNAPPQTNETDIETNRIIIRQRTPSSEENSTDEVGNALIMPSRIINNVGGVAIDKFANIFIADNGIISF